MTMPADQMLNTLERSTLVHHPNVSAEAWPYVDGTPAGRFGRLVREQLPTWVWVVRVEHVNDHFGCVYLGPVRDRELANAIAEAIERLHLPGLALLGVERQSIVDVPDEFLSDEDWRQTLQALRASTGVKSIAWLIDYLMRGPR